MGQRRCVLDRACVCDLNVSSGQSHAVAGVCFCIVGPAYLLKENVVGNIGIIVAVIAFSPALLVKRNNRDKK